MQAIIIIAHKKPEQVFNLCTILIEKFNVYVHFDKKCVLELEMKHKFESIGVKVFSHFSVNWGGYNIVAAELLLLREALKDSRNNYFHIISGEDWLVSSVKDIYDYYEASDSIFMTYENSTKVIKSCECVNWWYRLYFNYDNLNRRTFYGKVYHRMLLIIQLLLRVNKLKKLKITNEIYCGSQWMDLPRYSVEYIFDFLKTHEEYIDVFKTSFCPDEAIFQTILVNSKYKDKIVCNNHRYILWKEKYGNYPAILDIDDYDDIVKDLHHFCRKIDLKISCDLINKLMK